MEDLLHGSGAVVHNVQQAHVAPRLEPWGFQVWEGWRVGGRGVAGLSQVSQEVERPLLFTATFFMRLKNKVFSTNFSYYYDYVHMVVSEPHKILKNVSIFPENLFFLHVP